ncbi:MAG TPA: NepR family anti-sigma factor [Microvirga sp.]|jgi:hypothetical protein|nr:NepR family anti-sigma factor [Microvirga sp.]
MASIESRTLRAPRAPSPDQGATRTEILTAIGRSLQRVYAPMVDAPLPDHLAHFVAMLDQRQAEPKH